MPELSRDALFDALQARRHYATTGSRVHLMTRASTDGMSTVWTDDPRIAGARSRASKVMMMGDIVTGGDSPVQFSVDVAGHSPLLSLEIRRGKAVIETIRPRSETRDGARYRVEWSGAEYRGRARQTIWDGTLKVSGATITNVAPINFLNPDRPLRRVSNHELAWSSITTGNFAGLDLTLSGEGARLAIVTPQGTLDADLSGIGDVPLVQPYGKLGREIRISRLPAADAPASIMIKRRIELERGDNPIWICATFADGHQAWSSPIYFIREH
jgi:Protein of unknown function (DUF3604)